MWIRKLTASFGKLENETLRLHDGLNVIYAPNESGKSTWCAFIQAMLYGIDSSERSRAGYLPDKLRYVPWSGAAMEGSMELISERSEITITRRTRSKSAPMQDFSAVYTDTNVPVKGLTSANAGEMLTGVSRDVFRRSAFIAQGSIPVKGSPELERRINAIVSTGEESCSFSEADERLRAWQRRRRYNRRGLLPELEGRMDETERRLEELSGSMQTAEDLENRLNRARADCEELERQVTEARRRQRRDALSRLQSCRAELADSSARHDAAMEELSERRRELRQGRFGLREPAELEEELRGTLSEMEALRREIGRAPRALWAILCMLLALALAVAYTYLHVTVLIVLSAAACLAALWLLLRYGSRRRAREENSKRLQALHERCQIESAEELRAALDEHTHRWEAVRQAEEAEEAERARYEKAGAALTKLEEETLQQLDFTDGASEAASLGRRLTARRAEAEAISRQLSSLSGRLVAMGDPLVLASSLQSMKDEYEQICGEYDAISLAAETLRDADTELQRRFSPELGRVAAGYLSDITGGRYADVMLNRDFTAMARQSGDSVPHAAEYLSAGTLDILYLAVRLAVCELALPEGENCPLILDDALVNLDEERLAQAMELLGRIARERQVILFTCRKPG